MKKFCLLFILLPGFAFAFSICKRTHLPVEKNQSDTLKVLSVGQAGYFYFKGESKPIEIKFVRVIEDSRCPIGTECIWAGAIVVEILIDKTLVLKLSSVQKPFLYKDFQISLTSAVPYPKDGSEIKPNTYKVGFRIVPY